MNKLSVATKILYGIGNTAFGLLASTVGFFLMFYYTDIAKIDPAMAGTAMLVSKFTWDAINDPLFGYFSDRTRSRFGRRRPYLLFGAIPLGIAIWLLFSLPQQLTGTTAFLLVCGSYLLFDTFRSLVGMNYSAMSAELTRDYNERTGIMAVSNIFSVFGYIIGAALTSVVVSFIMKTFGLDEAGGWSGMALFLGTFCAIAILITGFGVRQEIPAALKPSTTPPIKSIISAFKNRAYVSFLVIAMLSSFVLTLVTGMLPYFMIYQMGMKSQLPIAMLSFLLTVLLFIYPFKMLADRLNKGPAFALGLGIATVALGTSFLLPSAPSPLVYVVFVLAGIGFSAQWVLPGSMLPDVIELDEKETGERREGIYFGIRAFLEKLVSALGSAVIGWGLAFAGYAEGVEQTAQSLLGIRLLFGLIPAAFMLICIPLLLKYPITKATHAALVEELAQK